MSRELLILRHARAGHRPGLSDRDRALDPVGERDATRVGRALRVLSTLPDTTRASPALRAITTARLALGAAAIDAATIVQDRRIYEATLPTLLAIVAELEAAPARVLLVGHNPGLEALVLYLTGDHTPLASGALVRLDMPARWRAMSPGCASVRGHFTPATAPTEPPPGDAGT